MTNVVGKSGSALETETVAEAEADSTAAWATGQKIALDCRMEMSEVYASRQVLPKARWHHHEYDCVILSQSGCVERVACVISHHPNPNHAQGRKMRDQ